MSSLMRFVLLLWLSLYLPGLAAPDPQLIESFLQTAERERRRWQIPGMAVGIISEGRLQVFRGLGQRSVDDPAAPDAQTVFAIGSATKPFGSATLALAVEEGKLSWDDRVCELDPEFQMSDPWVTREFRVFDLLAQHPGVRPYALSLPLSLGYSAEHLMKVWRYVPAEGHFRSSFAYVNIPHLFAGRILARLWKLPDWEAVVQQKLLARLEMRRTSGRPELLKWPNLAPGHRLVGGRVRRATTRVFPFNAGPAGCLHSSVEDLTRWVALQLQGSSPWLSAANLARTRQPQTFVDDSTAYAMGWAVRLDCGGPIYWHTGGTLTHACIVCFQPETQTGLVILTNLGDQNLAYPLAMRFYEQMQGKPESPALQQAFEAWQQSNLEPAPAYLGPAGPEFAGRYESPLLGDVEVQADGAVHLRAINLHGTLQRVGADTFHLVVNDPEWTDLGLEQLFVVQFRRDLQGNVRGLQVEQPGRIGLDSYAPRTLAPTR